MISLPALEEPFVAALPADRATGRASPSRGSSTSGGRQVVLFTTEPLDLREANALLLQRRLPRRDAPGRGARMEQIPVLGTGKTDYKQLRALILEGTAGHAP